MFVFNSILTFIIIRMKYVIIFLPFSCQKDSSYQHNNEMNSSILFNNLQKSFVNKKKGKKYPSYYAGAYLKDSSLVVIIIGDTLRSRKDLIKRCRGSNFELHPCKKKQDAVRKILHYLYQFRINEQNKDIVDALQFRASYMNSKRRINVQLLTFQEDKFRQLVLDSPFLDFEKSIIVFE